MAEEQVQPQGAPEGQSFQSSPTQEAQVQEQLTQQVYAGKYKSVQELEKGYLEMQKKLSQQSNSQETSQSQEAPTQPQEIPSQVTPLDMRTFEQEYVDNGGLSEETYQALEARGINRNDVDSYIEARSAQAEATNQKILEAAGGEEQFDIMVNWAAKSLDVATKTSLNNMIQSGDINQALMAVENIRSRYTEANGSEGQMLRGGTIGVSNGFENQAQALKAMDDPRYKTDEAYRREFARKLNMSNFSLVSNRKRRR